MSSVSKDTRDEEAASGGRARSKERQVDDSNERHVANGSGAPSPVAQASAMDDRHATLTIEQLAAEVGMSVRNIRNHHSRGLLPPPEVRGRVGYYGAEHIARLRLVLELQADGFNLAAIERLLSGSSHSAARLLGLRDALSAHFESETSEVITGEELRRRFGPADARDAMLVSKLKLLVPLGDDRYEVPSPALLKAAEEVTELGIPLRSALELVARLSRDCESISRAFVKLYLKELWEPFAQAGRPEESWPELIDAIGALRGIASEALLGMFKLRMAAEVEAASGKLLEREIKHPS